MAHRLDERKRLNLYLGMGVWHYTSDNYTLGWLRYTHAAKSVWGEFDFTVYFNPNGCWQRSHVANMNIGSEPDPEVCPRSGTHVHIGPWYSWYAWKNPDWPNGAGNPDVDWRGDPQPWTRWVIKFYW